MEIPFEAVVDCLDGQAGYCTHVIIEPESRRLTHLVLLENCFFGGERLVAVSQIISSGDGHIRVRYTKQQLNAAPAFLEHEYVSGTWPLVVYPPEQFAYWPIAIHRNVPAGEIAMRSGARVRAADGWAGRVAGFVTNYRNDAISRVVLREGHFWHARDVVIPISQVDEITESGIHVTLDHHTIELLPPLPAHHAMKA